VFLTYQVFGVLLSLMVLMLTFESHFTDYWHIEGTLFFLASLLIWGGITFVTENPIPVMVLAVAAPIVTVMLPWNWHLQLVISSLCTVCAALSFRILTAVHGYDWFWIPIAAESTIAVLAAVQLQRQREQQELYLEALVADEEQFRSLIENSPDGLTVVNVAGNIVFEGPSIKRLLGYNAEDLLRRNAFEFLHHEDAPRFRDVLTRCLQSPQVSLTITVRCLDAHGSWRTIESVGKQLSNYGSEPLIVFNWRDVTERAAHELRLRESEEKFRKVFQYSTNTISIASIRDGCYIEVNDEFTRVSGYTRAEAIGKTPLDLNLWLDPDDYLSFAREFLQQGEIRDRETEFRAKDGSIVVGLFSAVKLEMGGDEIALGLLNVLSRIPQLPLTPRQRSD
jgi:PAS domain S-box-containing protein